MRIDLSVEPWGELLWDVLGSGRPPADCGINRGTALEVVEVAIAEPQRVVAEASGTLTTEQLACALSVQATSGRLVVGSIAITDRAGGGLSGAYPSDGGVWGGSPAESLVNRFVGLTQSYPAVAVGSFGPDSAPIEVNYTATPQATRVGVVLPDDALAGRVARWITDALTHMPSADIAAHTDGGELILTVRELDPATRQALRAHVVEAFRIPSGSMIPTLAFGDHVLVAKHGFAGTGERGDVVAFHVPCDPSKLFIKRVIATGGDSVEVRCGRVYVNGEALALEPRNETCTYWDYDEDIDMWNERQCAGYREAGAYSVIHSQPLDDELDRHDFPEIPRDGRAPRHPVCFRREDTRPKGAFESVRGATQTCDQQLAYRVPDGHLFVVGDNRSNSSDSRVWGVVPEGSVVGKVVMIWWPGRQGPDGEIDWSRIRGID